MGEEGGGIDRLDTNRYPTIEWQFNNKLNNKLNFIKAFRTENVINRQQSNNMRSNLIWGSVPANVCVILPSIHKHHIKESFNFTTIYSNVDHILVELSI